MKRLERILKIDSMLHASKGVSLNQLAQELEVSKRMIYYDLAFLRDRFHAPLQIKEGIYFYTDFAWHLPDADLTQGEIFALLLGKQMLQHYWGSAYQQELSSAIETLVKRLPKKVRADFQALSETYTFSHGTTVQTKPFVWSELQRAILNRHPVLITYNGLSRLETTTRQVDPYLIHDVRGSQYLIGLCQLRQEIRSFRLNRIETLEVLSGQTFQRKPDFDCTRYLQQAFQIEVRDEPVPVKILFYPEAAKYIREKQWHPSQQIEEHPTGSLILNMEVSSLEEVKRWLLTWGRNARVLEPTLLLDYMKNEIEALQQVYQIHSPHGKTCAQCYS